MSDIFREVSSDDDAADACDHCLTDSVHVRKLSQTLDHYGTDQNQPLVVERKLNFSLGSAETQRKT